MRFSRHDAQWDSSPDDANLSKKYMLFYVILQTYQVESRLPNSTCHHLIGSLSGFVLKVSAETFTCIRLWFMAFLKMTLQYNCMKMFSTYVTSLKFH